MNDSGRTEKPAAPFVVEEEQLGDAGDHRASLRGEQESDPAAGARPGYASIGASA